MKNAFLKSIRALVLGTLSLGAVAMPHPREAVASTPRPQTFTYRVWAHSFNEGDFGHHDVAFVGTEREALGQLSVYQLAWGQQLQRQGRRYNSIGSRCIKVE